MMDIDDEKITLRDKIAISLLEGYLNNNSDKEDSQIKYALLDPARYPEQFQGIQTRIRAAYKMADLIRKIRLEAFS